jgi:plastocyanin
MPSHSAIRRENNETGASREPLSLWLLGFYALILFIASFYIGRYSGHLSGTSLDPSSGDREFAAIASPAASSSREEMTERTSSTSAESNRVVHVSIHNMQFVPARLEIKQGDVVEWTNDDLTPHTATSATFDSGSIEPDKSWRRTFTEAGEFPYACTFHPDMKATVVAKQ